MKKVLILYYSYEKSTQKLAEYLSNELQVDIEKIMPIKEMKAKGFSKYILGGSQVVRKSRPNLVALKSNLEKYDLILLGSPIWAGTLTPPVYSLLKSGSIKNKQVAYFYVHEGGAKKAAEKAKAIISENNFYLSSFSCPRVNTEYESIRLDLLKWAKEIIKNN